jgi:hypothetical protein
VSMVVTATTVAAVEVEAVVVVAMVAADEVEPAPSTPMHPLNNN